MEDYKIVFYILVGIGYLIYQNYQKVKANRPGNSQEHQVEKTLSEKFEELVNKTREELKKPEVTVVPAKIKYVKPIAAKLNSPFKTEKSKSLETIADEATSTAAFFNKEFSEITKAQTIKYEMETENVRWKFIYDGINLRQAFIHSVILQRPSY